MLDSITCSCTVSIWAPPPRGRTYTRWTEKPDCFVWAFHTKKSGFSVHRVRGNGNYVGMVCFHKSYL